MNVRIFSFSQSSYLLKFLYLVSLAKVVHIVDKENDDNSKPKEI